MQIRLSFALTFGLALAAHGNALAQTPTPTPTPDVLATPEATPEPEPTPEPMPTPEPIPEEGVNAGKPTAALVHGFVITRYDNSDGKGPRKAQNGYSIQNARIRIEGKSAPGVTYLAALEPLLPTGPLQEAYVGWNPTRTVGPMREIRLRVGQMRKPIGLEGRTPEEALHTMDHTVTTRLLQGVSHYDLGMSMGTTISIFDVDVGIFNGTGPANPLFGGTSVVGGVDPLDDKMVVGRGGLNLMEGKILTGLSFSAGEQADPVFLPVAGSPGIGPQSVQTWRAAVDVMAEMLNMVVQAEAVYGNSTLIDPTPSTPDGPTATSGSGYLFFGYRLPRGLMPHVRFEYLERTIGDDEDILFAPRDWNNAVAIGVNWDPVKHVRVRSQYEMVTGLASQPQLNNYYNPANGPVLYSDEMSGTFSVSLQADF